MDRLKLGLGFTLTGLVVAGAGALYQALSAANDRRSWPSPGQWVAVDGRRLHYQVAGHDHDGPTVILEAGGGSWSLEWELVQAEVARFARVVSYDRAGYGWSDPSPDFHTSTHVAQTLRALLVQAKIPGPYLLVGRSTGGLHVRRFAQLFGSEVVGMVLVDAVHEDEKSRIIEELRRSGERELQLLRVLRLLAPLGLVRLAGRLGLLPRLRTIEKLAPDRQQMALAGVFRSCYLDTLYREFGQIEEGALALRSRPGLGDLPLVVITAGQHLDPAAYPRGFKIEEAQRDWQDMQADLRSLSSRAHQVVLEGCGPYIPIERPDAVVRAVQRILEHVHPGSGR